MTEKRRGEASFDGVVGAMVLAALNHGDVENVSEMAWPRYPKEFRVRLANGRELTVTVESDFGRSGGNGG